MTMLLKMNFDLMTLSVRGWGCGRNSGYHAATFCYSISFNMQDGHVLKKVNVDLLTTSPGSWVSVGCHVAKFVIPFNFIFNMIMF